MEKVDVQTILMVVEIILLILTACLIPILNMWMENKISKVKEELRAEFMSKESAKYIEEKLDKLTASFETLNQFLLENWNKK